MAELTAEQIVNRGKLVAALRSGEYEQATGMLRKHTPRGDQFCCLGVACNVYWQETGQGKWGQGDGIHTSYREYIPFTVEDETQNTRTPDAVNEYFGIGRGTSEEGDDYDSLMGVMMNLNDSKLASFNQIADKIEVKGE